MAKKNFSPGAKILKLWSWFSPWPGGRWLFSKLFAFRVPYTSSISAKVEQLSPGQCKVTLRDRRAVRNHLNSIHAIALVNLGEMVSGLALLTGLAKNVRGIVINISIDYFKKARGTLTAQCHCEIPDVVDDIEYPVVANITDQQNDVVATVKVIWRLGVCE